MYWTTTLFIVCTVPDMYINITTIYTEDYADWHNIIQVTNKCTYTIFHVLYVYIIIYLCII